MKKWFPCYRNEDEFIWATDVFLLQESSSIKAVATPMNKICNTCDNFKNCVDVAIKWAVEQEKIMDKNTNVLH